MVVDDVSRLNDALAGRYRIERALGEGGMAVVYLADDTRHGRKVALKVLRPELAAAVGAERFLTEIKTTANLQHPNIVPLFDSGAAGGFLFYVMPHVEGESLQDRLDREHQLPVDEALRIATNAAEALDYAHRHGVVHRDVKPGNVLLVDGKAVVSDFGIALALGAAGTERLTEQGSVLGTPHYMSPEQATGDVAVGPPSDIYSLACVLYRMLVGEPPFTGGTPQAVLGRIITGATPSASAERASVPLHVDEAIRRALEKIPADRFARADDFARALADPTFRHRDEERDSAAVRGAWLVPALSAVCVALVAALGWSLRPPPPQPPERFVVPFEPGMEPAEGGTGISVTPDGAQLVYGPRAGGLLRLRRFTELEARGIPGTDGESVLDFEPVSPDGAEIAFRSDGQIHVVSLEGGAKRTLTPGRSAGWGPDGYVYVSTDLGLDRVPAAGGPPEPVTRLTDGELIHRFSGAAPGGILLAVDHGDRGSVDFVDFGSLERTRLVSGSGARWLESGHLAYLVDGTLTVDGFDPGRRLVRGTPVVLQTGVAAFDVATDGRLVYWEASAGPGLLELVWVSRSGAVEPVREGWRAAMDGGVNLGWTLSPDDSEISFARWVDGNWDIWVMETAGGEMRRLTDHPSQEFLPRWSRDGSMIDFVSFRADSVGGPLALWTVPRDGGEAPTLLFGDQPVATGVWSPDGQWLVLRTTTGRRGGGVGARDIVALRPGVDSLPRPLVASPDAEELEPEVSPDGRWLAYTSNETGRPEVYVQPFPESGGRRWSVSLNGGILPHWSRQGDELFFARPDTRELISVRFDASSTFRVVSRDVLFVVPPGFHLVSSSNAYDISADGRRFLMARTPPDAGPRPVRRVFVIDGWAQDVERRLRR